MTEAASYGQQAPMSSEADMLNGVAAAVLAQLLPQWQDLLRERWQAACELLPELQPVTVGHQHAGSSLHGAASDGNDGDPADLAGARPAHIVRRHGSRC